jgi:hypothetical protein
MLKQLVVAASTALFLVSGVASAGGTRSSEFHPYANPGCGTRVTQGFHLLHSAPAPRPAPKTVIGKR